MTGAVTLAAAAVASVGVGAYSASQQGSIAGQQLDMGKTVFNEQQQFAQQLWDLIQNPSSVTQLPGYQFNFDQGAQAVARQMASSGFSGSGNEAAALTQYGQGYAMNTFNQYASLLAGLSGLGSSVNPTQALGGASSANTASYNQLGGTLASLGYLLNSGTGGYGGGAGGYGGGGGIGWGGGSPGGGGGTMPAGGGFTFSGLS